MTYKFLLLLLIQGLLQYGSCQEKQGIFFRNDYTYIARQNSFYKFHTLEKTWFEARKTCEKEGSTLFYALDNTESKDVKDFWRKTQPQESIFIGISALVVKGVYETIDGQAVSSVYNKWAPGEPNDLDSKEDCVVMGRDSGMFSDDDCSKKLPFICKKSFATLNWNSFCELPDPAYRLNGVLNSCYKFHLNPMNWTEAYTTCNTEQSHLAIIDSQAEADFLVKLIAEAPKDNIPGNYLRGAVHIGFHNRDMGGWRTITGTRLEDSGAPAWCCNQPDGGDDELCGSIFYTGQLNDIGCWQKMFFICEHEIKNFNFNVDFRVSDV